MKILGIDTSGSALSVAVTDGTRLLAEYWIDRGLTHSQQLMPAVDKVLGELQLTPRDMDAFACAKGPGSFTGLRIGTATVKALAFATQKPAVGVNTLEALCYPMAGAAGILCPMLDARHAQVFGAAYRWRGDSLETLIAPQASELKELLEAVKAYGETVFPLGDGAVAYAETVKEGLGGLAAAVPAASCPARASSVAWTAARMLEAGAEADGRTLKPEYLRKSQAEQEKERREKQGGETR